MRVIDILSNLTEASIFTNPDYTFGHKVRPNTSGAKLVDQLVGVFPDYDRTEDLTWLKKPKNKIKAVVTTGKGGTGNLRYFSRPNGDEFAIDGTDSRIQSMFNHAPGMKGSTAENKGDASEPVLSAAVVAKLIKRGSNSIEPITGDDIKAVLNAALQNPNLTYNVIDKNSSISDTISFTIRVKEPVLGFLHSPAFWTKYDPVLPSVVHYANSGQLDHYANHFYKNGKADTINVKSDGVTDAHSRKTDVEAIVNGRPLKNLNISLKAGSSTIGQEGAGILKDPFKQQKWSEKDQAMVGQKGIWTTANDLFGPFGVAIPRPAQAVTDKLSFWEKAYITAAKQIKARLKGQDIKGEANFVKLLADYVTKHATLGDPDIKLISLGVKGVSTIHSFKNLEQKLHAANVNLDCVYREGWSDKAQQVRPELRIFDKTSGQTVLNIRYSSTKTGNKIWNQVSMEHLLKKLTTLSYEKQIPTAPADPIATPADPIATPAATPVAPVATAGTAKPLTIEPVKHDANAFPQWKGRQPKNPGLAPVGTLNGTTTNISSTTPSYTDDQVELMENFFIPEPPAYITKNKKRIK
jgi:hypothetical protein